MKKAYVSILTIITILCVVFGTMYHTGLFFRNAAVFPFSAVNFGRGSDKNISFSEEYEDISQVLCNMDLMNVTINSTDGSSVKINYEGNEKLKPSIENDNGHLSLTQPQNVRLGFKDADLSKEKSRVTLSIPKDTVLTGLDVDLDMGSMEIYDISSDKLDLSVDMGSVSGTGLILGDVEIDSNMGNVELGVKDVKNLAASTNMGNVIINSEKDLSNYSFSCAVDMGSILINDRKVSGDYEKEGSEGTVNINTNMGSVTVKY